MRGEADKIVTPHKGHGFEEGGTKRGDMRIDGRESSMHGCPGIGKDSKGLPSRKVRHKKGDSGAHVFRREQRRGIDLSEIDADAMCP